MLIVLLVIAAVAVLVTAAIAVNAAVQRTSANPPPAVWQIDEAVDWIADRLPTEVASQISHADVQQILLWHLDYFETVGLATSSGAEIGGDAVPVDHERVVADDNAAVDYVVEKSVATKRDFTALDIVCVLDLHMQFLVSIGAVGIPASGSETA